jgi:hypothetical protein
MQKRNIKIRYKNIEDAHSFAGPGGGQLFADFRFSREGGGRGND